MFTCRASLGVIVGDNAEETASDPSAEAGDATTPWARVDAVGDGRAIRVQAGGDIDQATVKVLVDGLDDGVRRAAEAGVGVVVLDLDAIDFLASAGLSALIHAHNRLHEAGRELVVVLAEDHKLVRLLWTTALNQVVTVVPSVEAALTRRVEPDGGAAAAT